MISFSTLTVENLLIGKTHIIGADECGYGSIAGPLVVCGVRAPKDWTMPGLNDSKKLTPKRREALREKLLKIVDSKIISYHIAERDNVTIDKFGVYPVLKECYVEIFHKLYSPDSLIIIDGNLKFDNLGVDGYTKHSEPKADGTYPIVGAASILGKTYHDEQMLLLHEKFPQYGWDKNMGYPGKTGETHKAAIIKYGPCSYHRYSYDPIKSMDLTGYNQLELKGLNE